MEGLQVEAQTAPEDETTGSLPLEGMVEP